MNMLNDILNQDLDPAETREWTEALGAVEYGAAGDRIYAGTFDT